MGSVYPVQKTVNHAQALSVINVNKALSKILILVLVNLVELPVPSAYPRTLAFNVFKVSILMKMEHVNRVQTNAKNALTSLNVKPIKKVL